MRLHLTEKIWPNSRSPFMITRNSCWTAQNEKMAKENSPLQYRSIITGIGLELQLKNLSSMGKSGEPMV